MYEDFYSFSEKPFSLTPDPKFLFLSKQYQGALDHMLYGIRQREGFMVIMGDVGTGKTTLCRSLLDQMEKNVEVALIINPLLSDMDLLRTCVHDLRVKPIYRRQEKSETIESLPVQGENSQNVTRSLQLLGTRLRAGGGSRDIQVDMGIASGADAEPDSSQSAETTHVNLVKADDQWVYQASKKELIDALNVFLLKQYEKGGSTVLIIDEAQNLTLEVMEQLRILSNLETEKEKLLQIIFVGQLELGAKLKMDELKQLNQRISIRYNITPLSKEETKAYVAHRILIAGATPKLSFTNAALSDIYSYSKGYPRLINLVCDRALLAGHNAQTTSIGVNHVKQAIKSLRGEEDQPLFDKQKIIPKALFIASILFFISGLAFYFLSGNAFSPQVKESKGSAKEVEKVETTIPEAPSLPSESNTDVSANVVKPVDSSSATAEKVEGMAQAPTESKSTSEEKPAGVTPPPAVVSEKKEPEVKPVAVEKPPAPATAPTPAKKESEAKVAVTEKTSAPVSAPAPAKKEPEAKTASAKKEDKDTYRIQVDSVKTDALAISMVDQLKKSGYKAYWKKIETKDQFLYIVYVGPFDTLDSANFQLNSLKQIGHKPVLFSVSKFD